MRTSVFLAALILATPAAAWASPDSARVEVTADPGGASGLIRGSVEIEAAPDQVWKALVDCDRAARMVAELKSCRVLESDPAGRWDVREHVSRAGLLPEVRNVFRSDYDPPYRIQFQKAGGELKVFEGEWRLVPLDGGQRTRVIYENRATAPFSIPGPIARMVLRHDVLDALNALRREVLAQR